MYELHALDEGAGDVVMLLHAFPCDHTLYEAQYRALVAAGYRVLVPDLPGFGGSAVPDREPSLDFSAQAVFDLLDDRSLSSATVVGLSLGGYVAMAMLRQQPARVAGLALIDTKCTADPAEQADVRRAMADQVLAEHSTQSLVPMLPKLLGSTTLAERPAVVERVTEYIQAADPAGIAWSQRAMAARPDSSATLAEYRGRALVVRGLEDQLSSQEDTQTIVDVLPQPELALIPECGHLSAIEAPKDLSRHLLEFLID